MPLGTMTTKNAVKIIERMGDVKEVENPLVDGKLLRIFMRVRVEIDILKPLSIGCRIPRKDLPKTWIVFRYERLQNIYYKCSIIGHDHRSCSKERLMSSPNIPKYGPELGVPAARSLSSIAATQTR